MAAFLVVALGVAVALVLGSPGQRQPVVEEASADTPDGAHASFGAVPERLTPEREWLPELAYRANLEAAAAEVPPEQRQSVWPGDRWYGLPEFDGQPASPLFSDGGELIGIRVVGVGTVDVATYQDPDLDMEDVLVDRIGEDEYLAQMEDLRARHGCGDGLGDQWSHDELLACMN